MIKKLYLLIIPVYTIAITDPFSNSSENQKNITVTAIASCNKNCHAIVNFKNSSHCVKEGSKFGDTKDQWQVSKIADDHIVVCHLNSGKDYQLTL